MVRLGSVSVRNYLETAYPGKRTGSRYRGLYRDGEIIDTECEKIWASLGKVGVDSFLDGSDTMEHLLSNLGAQVVWLQTRDREAVISMRTACPPGEASIMPRWKTDKAFERSKAVYQQRGRTGFQDSVADGFDSSDDSLDGGAGASRRVRNNRGKKAKAKAKGGEAAAGVKK